MDNKILESIQNKKNELDSYRPLSSAIAKKLAEQIKIEWTYNTNAIEGNTLTLQETEIVIKNGITIGGKSLNEHLEAINHKQGIEYIEQIITEKKEINEEIIKELHYMILKGIDDTEAGKYRNQNVRIVGANIIPPQSIKVPSKMEELLNWYNENQTKISIPQLAAQMHYKLVCIHPFIDGNGRVSRLLMNLILMKNGYPPAIILNVDRKKYYKVLNEANLGKLEPFEDFIGRSIDRSLVLYLNSVKPNLQENEGFILLKDATQYCDYSQEYLSLLARKGKLSAIKLNNEWVTTKGNIEEYIKKKGKR